MVFAAPPAAGGMSNALGAPVEIVSEDRIQGIMRREQNEWGGTSRCRLRSRAESVNVSWKGEVSMKG